MLNDDRYNFFLEKNNYILNTIQNLGFLNINNVLKEYKNLDFNRYLDAQKAFKKHNNAKKVVEKYENLDFKKYLYSREFLEKYSHAEEVLNEYSSEYKTIMSKMASIYPILKAAVDYSNKTEIFFRNGTFTAFRHTVSDSKFKEKLRHVLSYANNKLQISDRLNWEEFFNMDKKYMKGLNNHSFLNLCSIHCGYGDQLLIPKDDDIYFYYSDIRISKLTRANVMSIIRRLKRLANKYTSIINLYTGKEAAQTTNNSWLIDSNSGDMEYPCFLIKASSNPENIREIDNIANKAWKSLGFHSMKGESIEQFMKPSIDNRNTLIEKEHAYILQYFCTGIVTSLLDPLMQYLNDEIDIKELKESLKAYNMTYIINLNILSTIYTSHWANKAVECIDKRKPTTRGRLYQRGYFPEVLNQAITNCQTINNL
ncbi:hypothetical protein [Francisella sp. SYW-9]|uniref:hypothetical protein n=1 Tax=Francisella sp. SYW-9 TaxID=2610888 RepID=UPI00123E1927|nr:hypothetical protein [Francisella sp. SYW-9]